MLHSITSSLSIDSQPERGSCSLLAQPLQSSAGSRMVGHGHEAEVVFVGCLCIAVLLFFLAVGIWQQRVWLPRRAKELLGELRKDRMEKRV